MVARLLKRVRPAAKWYFDADTIGPGKVLADVRPDVTGPGDSGERRGPQRLWLPPSPVPTTDIDDDEWIPLVAAAGMTIITRDRHIQSRLAEREAVRTSGARMFAINAAGAPLNRWHLLEIVVGRWRDMEAMVAVETGPFIYTMTRTGEMKRTL